MELTPEGPHVAARKGLAASAESSDGAASRSHAAGDQPSKAVPSRRELEVAALIRHGLTNAEIAERLGLTPGTVANHVANVLGRLNLRNRAQLAVWATEHGVGETRGTLDPPSLE